MNMKKYWIYILSLIYLICGLIAALLFNGTGDSGDSIFHYQFARFAPQHPELYFNHWAKPLFVLLASPFAQFGFVGIKIFNVINASITLLFSFLVAKKLNLKNILLLPFFFLFTPFYTILIFSGLTEPLFALFLILSIYLLLKNKLLFGAILVSFLPFIRSEGLLIIGVIFIYLLYNKSYKIIPFLFAGHLLYSVLGYFYTNDFFWVFNKIPYNKLSSPYGNGTLLHFTDQFTYLLGPPIYFLLIVGVFSLIWQAISKKSISKTHLLILLSFLSFFVAHSLFWYLGIFNSMGLTRVFVAVMPLIVILTLIGFNQIRQLGKGMSWQIGKIAAAIALILVFLFPFTPNHGSVKKSQFALLPDQILMHEMAANLVLTAGSKYLYSHPYAIESIGIDPFDKKKSEFLSTNSLNELKKGDFIIWDNWFSVTEHSISLEMLKQNNQLNQIADYIGDLKNSKTQVVVFQKN